MRRNGISQIVWSPLAQGVLTGKYQPGEAHPEGSRAASESMGFAMDLVMSDETLEAVERLRADRGGRGPDARGQLALAWVLRRPELASAIVGASRPEQVHANALGVRDRRSQPTCWRRSTRRSAMRP